MRHDARLPQYMRSVPRTKPLSHEPGQLLTPRERAWIDGIEHGSETLLRALWKQHHRIMLVHQANGLQVVQP